LRLIIASLVIFSIIILFLFALFPSDISVTRIIRINRPASQVREKIADLREWKNWNELLVNGPSRDVLNSQSDKTGSAYLSIGGVSVELLKAGPDTVVTRWRHGRRSFTGNFNLSEMNGQVVVEWTLHFHLNWYPWEKLASMFYDKELGPLMEQSLVNLRRELESSSN
jgi:hypothetical protein